MFEDDVTVPAGWYPDPMGLPQLRWWNNHAWTELTTEARPPLVMQQPAQLLYADEELPTRRQQREQRERDAEYADAATDDQTEMGAAAEDAVANDTATNDVVANDVATDDRRTGTADEPATVTIREIESSVAVVDAGPGVAPSQAPRPASRLRLPSYTAPVWIIALLPLLQLVVGLLVLVGVGAFPNLYLSAAAVVAPYLLVIAMAIVDRALLRRAGHDHPAHWAWAFLSAPVYLVARAIGIGRSGSFGVAPLLVWAALAVLQVASVLVVPGMLISVLPAVFSAQAEQSVAADASVVGATLDVHCPTPPALLIGQTFSCSATSTAGHDLSVTVSLQRANGWIDWKVEEWGNTFVN